MHMLSSSYKQPSLRHTAGEWINEGTTIFPLTGATPLPPEGFIWDWGLTLMNSRNDSESCCCDEHQIMLALKRKIEQLHVVCLHNRGAEMDPTASSTNSPFHTQIPTLLVESPNRI